MSFAVIQTEVEPPSTEQLARALAQVPGLTEADGLQLAHQALGVLAKGFDAGQAAALQAALSAQGITTEVVEESSLGELPVPKCLNKSEFSSEALMVQDVIGLCHPLPWADISIISAGQVTLTEFHTVSEPKLVVRGAGKGVHLAVELVGKTEEEPAQHWLLEIMTHRAAQRYHASAEESLALFACLGDRRTRDTASNMILLVTELAARAPQALLNHGAFYMKENGRASYAYPNKTLFYREITWLLGMASTGRAEK